MKRKQNGLRQLMENLGVSQQRDLTLAKPMTLEVSRIGYVDEGLRLTIALGCPYKLNAEVKLGRADAEWLMKRLQQELVDPRNENMPK